MSIARREFLQISAGTAGATLLGAGCAAPAVDEEIPDSIRQLSPMTQGVVPISDEERLARIEKARRLMVENGIGGMFLEGGSGLFYFTGVRWGLSERTFGAVLPARGEIAWVCPKFEEDRARELIRFGDDVRTWEEDESPYQRVAQILRDRGVRTGKVAMEERVRFFVSDGISKEAPGVEVVSGDPVTIGCRVIKSQAEIALMQKAADITIEAYKAVIPLLHEGMTKGEFSTLATAAHQALGAEGHIGANFGESSALPHGSIIPRDLREGDVVLMDGGCSIDGYRSDISRTVVLGEPTQKQRDVWNHMKEAQTAAFEAAKVGVPCEDVDAAARRSLVSNGYGPDYKVPGCPHRTGHGIGLDGHEWINLVRGNKTPLAPGMCFSDEPMIVVPGEFGIRIEDCIYITDQGAQFFSQPSPSIDQACV